MVEEIKNHQRPIMFILVISILFLIFWVKARHIIEPFLFGGYIIVKLILLSVVFACLWSFINSFWIEQNSARRYILAGSVILLLTSIYYAKVIPLNNHNEGDMYPMLADGFAHGQLSLIPLPPSGLLALSDPYDITANADYRAGIKGWKSHDAVLFNGKYYIYFGPVPAVVLVMVNGLFHAGAGNDFLMFFFLSLCALMALLIVYRIWQRMYPEVSWKVALLCFLSIVWSFPAMWLVGRPAVYEAAISGGQAFLLTGLYLLLLAFDGAKRNNLLLIGAGIALGLAVGSRWNLAVAVILISILVLVLLVGPLSQKKLALKPFLAFFVPLGLLAIMYGYYNFARFGSPFELGTQYGLVGVNMKNTNFFSLENLKNNLILFGIMPPADLRVQYPFITFAGWSNQYIKYGITHSSGGMEALSAIFWLAPLSLAGLYPVFSLFRNFPGFRRSEATKLTFIDWLVHKDQLYLVFLILAAFGGFIPLLFFTGSTMRYHMDYFPAVGLLAAIGILNLFTLKFSFLHRDFIKSFLFFLVLYTMLLGGVASITSYFNTFAATTPEVVNGLNTLTKIFTEASYQPLTYRVENLLNGEVDSITIESGRDTPSAVGEWCDGALYGKGVEGWLQFGPYITFSPGSYRAEWYGEVLSSEIEGIGMVDVAYDSGKNIVAHTEITRKSLESLLQGQVASLEFSLNESAPLTEFRFYVNKNVIVRIDKVVIIRIPQK